MNTNTLFELFAPNNVPILRNEHSSIIIALLITLIFVKVVAYVFIFVFNKYYDYQYRKSKRKLMNSNTIKTMYTQIRSKHNGQQLEFPFVKEIDEQYVNARYNLLETNL